MLTDDYAEVLVSTIERIRLSQRQKILDSAAIASDVIAADGLVYVFGCGHSHILAEETFYRAGGLACVAPVFYEPLMLHEGAAESSRLEKTGGLADLVLEGTPITEKDMLICVSTSGVNSVPVELAQLVRGRGIPVVGISSDEYLSQTPGNPLGKHLQEVCDICINNFAPHGDACLSLSETLSISPVSTVASTFIINSLLAHAAQLCISRGVDVPLYVSGNIPGGAEKNRALIERYQKRIGSL